MRLPIATALVCLGACLGLSGVAQAASFDCAKARRPDEKAVCADQALNDKDVRMAVLYDVNKRTMGMGARGALMDGQQAWLKARADCRANRACLTRAYDRRLGELERSMERIYRAGPF
ncbi:MAG: lysozyme inhibitor LprI family protein [Caulobacter sp.]